MLKIGIITTEPTGWIVTSLQAEAELFGFSCDIIDQKNLRLITSNDGKLTVDLDKQYDIIIPRVSEYDIDVKMTILSIIQDSGVVVLNSPGGIKLASNKLLSQLIIANHTSDNISAIPTMVVYNDENIEQIVERGKFPVVIKTMTGTHGIGVVKCDSADSFKSMAQLLLTKHEHSFLVQDFIPHETSYRTIVLGDAILAANERGQANGSDFRTNAHRGAVTHAYTPNDYVVEASIALAKTFDLRFCAIDFILDANGRMLVLEVNGSPGLENIQTNFPDKNLCAEVIKYAANVCGVIAADVEPIQLGGKELETATVDSVEGASVEHPINTVGAEIQIQIKRLHRDRYIDAKVDTGADTCSLSTSNIIVNDETSTLQFTYANTRYTIPFEKAVRVKSATAEDDEQRRHVVLLDVTFNGTDYRDVEFNLCDRSHMKYDVLIGKNLLQAAGVVVDVS